MSANGWVRILVAGATISLGSCAGDGTGLDEFGNPFGAQPSVLTPTLASIQDNIFSTMCVKCHAGASAPLGLALHPGVAWENLVGVVSVEVPAMVLVHPGQPDSSYLIWKVEGRPSIVGGRMPLGYAPLPQEYIDAIRTWIEQGALQN